jgi:signal peptidase I
MWAGIGVAIAAALALGLVILLHHSLRGYTIPSIGMEPTIESGQHVSVDESAYEDHLPERGDIVVFCDPNPAASGCSEQFVKRMVGLPGETIEERRGVIYVDGTALDEPYIVADPDEGRVADTRTEGPYEVKSGHLFVLGDNRSNSNDSRYGLGQVPIDRVVGKVVKIG